MDFAEKILEPAITRGREQQIRGRQKPDPTDASHANEDQHCCAQLTVSRMEGISKGQPCRGFLVDDAEAPAKPGEPTNTLRRSWMGDGGEHYGQYDRT